MVPHTLRRRGLAALLLLAVAAGFSGLTLAAEEKPDEPRTAPIDLNRASEEELTSLPGVGQAIAKRIVAFREEHGPYRRVEDLLKVKGIGEKSFEKLRPLVKVEARS